jgi:hypothetical protein
MADVNSLSTAAVLKTDEECVPNNVVRDAAGNPVKLPSGLFLTSGEEILDPGPQIAKTQSIPASFRVSKNVLVSIQNPDVPSGIGRLSALQVKAVKTMIARAASGYSYNFISAANSVGKYQLNAETLSGLGYIKPEFVIQVGSEAVKKPAAWTGKDNITSLEVWFKSAGVQENSMFSLMENNYISMENNRSIKVDDNLCTIAGMLCVAHVLGPDTGTEQAPGAKRWRETGSGQDINGSNGSVYFLLGRYAVDVLAAVR